MTLVGLPCSEMWALLRNSHLGAMVIVRREGFSNDQWLMEGVNLLDLKYRSAGYFAADPSSIVRPDRCPDRLHRTIDESLAEVPRDAFDYIWLIERAAQDPKLGRGHAAGLARAGFYPLSSPPMMLSIVVPCFNEEACLGLHERLGASARKAVGEDYEIVLVNDGSRDRAGRSCSGWRRAIRIWSRSICRATTAISWR